MIPNPRWRTVFYGNAVSLYLLQKALVRDPRIEGVHLLGALLEALLQSTFRALLSVMLLTLLPHHPNLADFSFLLVYVLLLMFSHFLLNAVLYV